MIDKGRIYGAIFLFVVFSGLIYLIYWWKFQKPARLGPCIQVVTSARNPFTGEVIEFADPCSVPSGWVQIK